MSFRDGIDYRSNSASLTVVTVLLNWSRKAVLFSYVLAEVMFLEEPGQVCKKARRRRAAGVKEKQMMCPVV